MLSKSMSNHLYSRPGNEQLNAVALQDALRRGLAQQPECYGLSP